MKIFVTGQCTVHWGRLEYGNIGNYYITETTFRELHRVFPDAEIVTTFQMTDSFQKNERIKSLPMNMFYSWDEGDLDKALMEYGVAKYYKKHGVLLDKTPFISTVLESDLIIDFSGELWGDHADSVGKNRFLIGLLKIRVAQILEKKTILLAGSQGPFSDSRTKEFAKEVFENYTLVANRESASVELLKENGFNISKVQNFTDVAFLFEPAPNDKMQKIIIDEKIINPERPTVGFILCGFNMLEGPYDKWPRRDDEFEQFAESVEHIVDKYNARVIMFSHQNGFDLPPKFKLINGRDYPYAKGLYDVLIKRGKVSENDIHCISKPYLPKEIKAIIGNFDMLITGRIHGFVAGVSQNVPSVIINRGNGPKSMRNIGFARSVGFEEYLASPNNKNELINCIDNCWQNRVALSKILEKKIPQVQKTAKEMFNTVKEIL